MTLFYVKLGKMHATAHLGDLLSLVPEVVARYPIHAEPHEAAVPGKRDSLGAPANNKVWGMKGVPWLEERILLLDFLFGHDLTFDHKQ
jgi:hypothetical protein